MKCPIDQSELNMTDRQGVEIDYCPTCRGVWLDRGELDKIIERTDALVQNQPSPQASSQVNLQPADEQHTRPRYDDSRQYERSSHENHKQRSDHYNSDAHGKKRKKEGFLGDLFDF